jgi:2-succinyl-6-hydroxy-2,4-cyclohexadiene-1-carboxylate synthase
MPSVLTLHGFLGRPSDWDFFLSSHIKCTPVDLFSISPPSSGLSTWGHACNQWIKRRSEKKPILMGYSLGGRLAMHALIQNPSLYSGAIIISAHTGLVSREEKSRRFLRDQKWAERFLQDPWHEVTSDWNKQAVFQGKTSPFQREEKFFNRTVLAEALTGWSVAKQDNLKQTLTQLSLPVLWVAGEKDKKYADLATEMASIHPFSSSWIAKKTGHRVPWECSHQLLQNICKWMHSTIDI